MSNISALNISASALSVHKTKMDIVAQNIANAETIQTDTEQPYRRRTVTIGEDNSFNNILDIETAKLNLKGVQITEISEDDAPFEIVYDPDNPYANDEGYITKSNVNVTAEMLDLLAITRTYEANLTVFNSTKDLIIKTLKIAD